MENQQHWQLVQKLFEKGLSLPKSLRKERLASECNNDQAALAKAMDLLEAHDSQSNTHTIERVLAPLAQEILIDRIGDFELQAILGHGSMGVVYKAFDHKLERFVAIKLLTPQLSDNPEFKERFLIEAKAISRVSSPHVCTIYNSGETDSGQLYIAMEFCSGESLAAMLSKNHKFTSADIFKLIGDLVSALDSVHQQGVIHRDVKPENIIINNGRAKLVDFGVAKISDKNFTQHTGHIGTLNYMSPEQLSGATADQQSDIWALGILLYELFYGEKPFYAESPVQLLELINKSAIDFPKLKVHRSDDHVLASNLPHIINKALSIDKLKRYQNVDQLGFDIQKLAPNTSLQNPPTNANDNQAENRPVSLLCCIFDAADSEILMELHSLIIERVNSIASRYQGILANNNLSQLTIWFGLSKVQEDDPSRAIRTALGILRSISDLCAEKNLELAVRIAVHSDMVIVKQSNQAIIDPNEIVGNISATTMSICSHTPSSSLAVSQQTKSKTETFFSFKESEHFKNKPVYLNMNSSSAPNTSSSKIFEVIGERSSFNQSDLLANKVTPLINRLEELALLEQKWNECIQGRGQAIFLTGEPGIGKSRTTLALQQSIQKTPDAFTLVCQCSAFHENSALYPVINLLNAILDFANKPDDNAKLNSLEGLLSEYGYNINETAPLLAKLLLIKGIDRYPPLQQSPELQRQNTLQLLIGILLSRAARQPLLLIVEDFHWADATFAELIELLIEQSPTLSIMIVVTARNSDKVKLNPKANVSYLNISRLNEKHCTEMISAVAGNHKMSAQSVNHLQSFSDGVPLFIEELTKTSIEISNTDLSAETHHQIPKSLEESLNSRLHLLGSARTLLQKASVFGRAFSHALLERSYPEEDLISYMPTLIEKEFIFRRQLGNNIEYFFKHALMQETAYESLLKSERRKYHAKIASTLEGHFNEQAEQEPELVARHHIGAENHAQAISWLLKAGALAHARSAFDESINHYQKAEELLEHLDDSESKNQLELRIKVAQGTPLMAVHGYAAKQVLQTYRRALNLSKEIGSTPEKVKVLFGLWTFYVVSGQLRTARTIANQLHVLTENVGDCGLVLEACTMLGVTLFHLGEIAEAEKYLNKGIEIYDPKAHGDHGYIYGQDPGMACYSYLASVLLWQGREDEALQASERAISLARELGHAHSLAFALYLAARMQFQRGDWDRVVALTNEAIDISTKYRFPIWQVLASFIKGITISHMGDQENSLPVIRKTLAGYRARGAGLSRPYYLALHALAESHIKNFEAAQSLVEEALIDADKQSAETEIVEIMHIKAKILIAMNEIDSARDLLKTALEKAAVQGSKFFEQNISSTLKQVC